jgi:anti-sigma-K factor RskA
MTIDLHTLSGAYALDALSAEEAEEFSRHLAQCEACRQEVRELRAAAARMGEVEAVAAPRALKARVLAAADKQPQLPPRVTPLEAARSRRLRPWLAAAAAAVVLVVGGVIGVGQLRGPSEQGPGASVSQVFQAADAHTRTFTTADGGRIRVATSPDTGRMAIATKALRPLDHRTYQAWTLHNGQATSAGVLDGRAAGAVMQLPAAGTTVAITVEPPGGSKQPTTKPIVVVDPSSV